MSEEALGQVQVVSASTATVPVTLEGKVIQKPVKQVSGLGGGTGCLRLVQPWGQNTEGRGPTTEEFPGN